MPWPSVVGGVEANGSRFDELLKALWDCHYEDICRISESAVAERALPLLPPSSLKTNLPKGPGAALGLKCRQGPSDALGLKAIADPAPSPPFVSIPDITKRVVFVDVATSCHLEAGSDEKCNGHAVNTDAEEQPSNCRDEPCSAALTEEESDLGFSEEFTLQISARDVSGMDLALREVWIGSPIRGSAAKGGIGDTASSIAPEDMFREEPPETPEGCMSRAIMAPGNKKRLVWDLIGGFLVVFDMIRIPMGVFDHPSPILLDAMDWFTLLFWTVDMPASFFVGYVHKGLTVMDPWMIAKNYSMGWLLIDIMVVVPDWVFTVALTNERGSGSSVRLLRGLRMARILRLVRVMKLKWVLEAIIDYVDSAFVSVWVSILRMLITLLGTNHFIACSWYAVGTITDGTGWVQDFEEFDWNYLYLTSLHWAVTQFTPASMSVQPKNLTERGFAICVVFFALVFFSYIVGSITGSLSTLREMTEKKSRELWLLRRYMRRNRVPFELVKRILRFVEHALEQEEQKMSVGQVNMLRYLSPQLTAELECSMNLPHLEVHPLYDYLKTCAAVTMNKIAKDAVSRTSLARTDTLFLPSQTGAAMYFVTTGRVLYTRTLQSGEMKIEIVDADEDWIAEPVIWCAAWMHVGEAKAHTDSELLLVDPNQFEVIMKRVRPIARLCSLYASAFIDWQKTSELTDVIQGDEESDHIRTFIPFDW